MEFGKFCWVFFLLWAVTSFQGCFVDWTGCCYEGRNWGTEPHLAWVTCFRHLESHPSLSLELTKTDIPPQRSLRSTRLRGCFSTNILQSQAGWAARALPAAQPRCRRTTLIERISQSTYTGTTESNRITSVGSYTALFPLYFLGPQLIQEWKVLCE